MAGVFDMLRYGHGPDTGLFFIQYMKKYGVVKIDFSGYYFDSEDDAMGFMLKIL